jgi:methylated-DNA-[protein]-cysteine S-methyltransferase
MAAPGYTIFETPVGRCGTAWGCSGIVGMRLPEAREIETRRRLLQQFPEARELPPPSGVAAAIAAISVALRGGPGEMCNIRLDSSGLPPFNSRVYDAVRKIPRGETRTHAEIAT